MSIHDNSNKRLTSPAPPETQRDIAQTAQQPTHAAEGWCYIARDGTPGAYAICVDRPEWKKYTAQAIARWIKEGATVERLPHEQAVAEICKWKRPGKSPDLFAEAPAA